MIPIDPSMLGATGATGASGAIGSAAKGGGALGGVSPTGALDAAMGLFSTTAPILKNLKKGTHDRMNDKGHVTHKVNTLGNVTSMAGAGAKAGAMFGPLGGAIGGVVGGLAGGVMSILDKNKQPTLSEMIAENKAFNMGQHIKSIASNDTLIQQAQAAEDGLHYVKGTKEIEVEKDEIVLRKVGKVFKKVADFTGGKSHAQGGEAYVAEEGDIIFPGKQRELVNRALRTRDWKRLESMRASLPPDTANKEKSDGVEAIDPEKKKRLATTKPVPKAGTGVYPSIHIPKHDNEETQAEIREAYAKRMGLSHQQVSGFLDQRESDTEYYKNKSSYLNDYMKTWRSDSKNNDFTQVSPEYRAAFETGTKTWYKENPRQVNDIVNDYYNNGPAVDNTLKAEFDATSILNKQPKIKYAEGTSGIKTDPEGREWTAEAVDAFIKKHTVKGKKAPITGAKLLELAEKHDFPIELALIQGAVESNFGTKGAGTWTKNIYNWGNVTAGDSKSRANALKDGDRKVMDTVAAGVETYMKGVKRNYLDPVDGDWKKLLEDESFVNKSGNRYATEPKYEEMLRKIESTLPVYTAENSEDKVQAMRESNIKKLGYEPYEDYSSRITSEGGTPESESWYEQNVIAPLDEQKRGYWTMDSPKGRANYDADGVVRGDAQLEFHALSNKEKADKLKEAYVAFPDNPYLQNLEDKGYFDKDREVLEKVMGDHFSEENFVASMKDARRPGILNDIIHAGTDVFGNWFSRSTEENVDNDYHGITDKKLKEEALAFRSYLANNKDNGTLLGRKMHQAFNFIDRAVVAGLEGIEELDSGAQVSTGIANLLSGEDPEVVEKLINDAKEAGVLSEKGAAYAWHVATDPEVFKNQTAEAVEDINVIMAAKDAPRLIRKAWNGLPKAWQNVKGWTKAIKQGKLTKDGQLTAAGFKAIRNSKELRMKLKAAKNSKNSTAAKNLEKQLAGLYGGSMEFKGTETMAEMESLAKMVDDANVSMGGWKSTTREAISFFNNSWKSVKKLPSKTLEALGGKKFSEIADMERQLSKITGKTPKELRGMSAPDVAKIITETRKAKFKTLQDAIKAKEEAWKAYKPLKDNLAAAKKSLADLPEGAKNLEKVQEDIRLAEEALQQGTKTIEDLENLTKTNWDQIGKIEAWEATPEIASDFRQLVKGEQAIARHTDNLKDLEGSLSSVKADQAVWKGIKTEAKAGESIIENAADAVRLRDEGLATARAANVASGRAQSAVNTYETLAKKAPTLHKEIAKHADMVKTLKKGGQFTAEMYNILRKGEGVDLDALDKEAEEVFTPEEIENAGTPRPKVESVISGDGAGKPQGGTGTHRILDESDISSDINPLQDKVVSPTIGGEVKSSGVVGKIGGVLESLAEYAPAVYNIVKGLEDPEKITRRFVTPQTRKYENMSQPQLNAIDSAFDAAISNARNLSGGSMANFRANTEAAWADKIARTGAVNAHEAGRSDAIASENIGIRNQAEQINTQTHQKADIIDMQSEAATNSFLAQGIQDVANIAGMHRKDRNAEKNQNLVLKMMGEGRPFKAKEDGTIEFTG